MFVIFANYSFKTKYLTQAVTFIIKNEIILQKYMLAAENTSAG
jgi:hypothetical protein